MDEPNVTYLVDSYRFSWSDLQVEVLADRLHEARDGLRCELTVRTSRQPKAGLLRQGNFNLSSTTTRRQWQRALEERQPDVDWYAVLEFVCARSLRQWREGEPVVDLAYVEPRHGLPYLVTPLVVEGATTVLFAEGGSGKSLLALALALSVATGEEVLPGITPMRIGPVLYLDWEWDAESHAERLQAMCRGLEMEVPEGLIHYRHEIASVWEAAPTLRRRIAELGAVFVVIDSLGFARGGEPESAELTLKTFAAFRTFGVPVLALDHVAKNATDRKHSFGSIYTTNAARMTWRADAVKEEGQSKIVVGLSNQKANGRFQQPRGFEIEMDVDQDGKLTCVRFKATDLREVPGLTKSLAMRDQLAGILRRTAPLEVDDLVLVLATEGVKTTPATVRACLNRNKGMFQPGPNGWALKEGWRVQEMEVERGLVAQEYSM